MEVQGKFLGSVKIDEYMKKIAQLDEKLFPYNNALHSYYQSPTFKAAKLKYFGNLFTTMNENIFKNTDEHVVILIFEFLNLKAVTI